jgi:prepilin-type processing-associated H-X9-DG protein
MAPTPSGSQLLDINQVQERPSWIVHILPFIEEQQLFDKFDLTRRFWQANAILDRAQEQQPPILLCPSDSARGRYYEPTAFASAPEAQRRFGKTNYAAYVSPEHVICMRVFPGALINEPQKVKSITDGMSKSIMISEVRTLDNPTDPRGAWATGWVGGSILAFDLHSNAQLGAALNSPQAPKRNTAYIPVVYPSPKTDGLPPNTTLGWLNEDWIAECLEPNVAGVEGMPCHLQSGSRQGAAPRSLHPGGVNVARADGSGDFIINEIDQHLMARMVSINDGQGLVEGELK